MLGPAYDETDGAMSTAFLGTPLFARGVRTLTLVHIAVQVLDAAGVEGGRAADDAVDLVACI